MGGKRSLGQVAGRISRMSAHEIGVRLAQQLHKRLDEARYRLGLPAAREAVLAHGGPPGRFFFDGGEVPRPVELLRERFPEEASRVVARAEKICRHRFDLLGYEGLDFGAEIDWHLDPVHGIRAPSRVWFRIPFLDFAAVGDHKIIWELNRHQHLVTLAQAWWLARDDRYVEELLAQWYHWRERNPYPLGINWASSLEVAFRSLAWIWTSSLVAACPSVPEKFRRDVSLALGQSARYIEKYLSTYFAPNTHLLGEGLALFFIGTVCNEFASAARWRRMGWRIVRNEARRQVLADGMHFEQSTYYHVYALDMFLHGRLLAERNGVSVPPELDRTILRMAEALRMQSQAGAAPRFGDDDGGRLFDPARNRTEHLLDPLATAAVLFRRADFKAAAGGLREETLWLLGADGVRRFDELASEPAAPASGCCQAGGTYCLVSAEPVLREIAIDAGPHGAHTGGHGHADALSLQWIAQGRHWLTDPGSCSYARELPERDRFRGTAAHNTLEIDGLSQAEPAGPFSWRSKPETRVERWVMGRNLDLFVASHNGYCRLREPVTHRRWVVSWKSGPVLVRDLAVGKGAHALALHWHLGPEFRLQQHEPDRAVFATEDGATLALLTSAGGEWSSEVLEGEWSPAYGAKADAPVLRHSARVELPAEFAVLLSPNAPAARLEPLAAEGVSVYRFGSSLLWFSDAGGQWRWREVASDAAFLCVGPGQQAFLAGGTYLEIAGRRAVTCDGDWEGEIAAPLELSLAP